MAEPHFCLEIAGQPQLSRISVNLSMTATRDWLNQIYLCHKILHLIWLPTPRQWKNAAIIPYSRWWLQGQSAWKTFGNPSCSPCDWSITWHKCCYNLLISYHSSEDPRGCDILMLLTTMYYPNPSLEADGTKPDNQHIGRKQHEWIIQVLLCLRGVP